MEPGHSAREGQKQRQCDLRSGTILGPDEVSERLASCRREKRNVPISVAGCDAGVELDECRELITGACEFI